MDSKSLTFSIVTPSYNEEKDIRDTIECFIGLSYPHKEILVVDDSSDQTADIVLEYASRGVRLIRGTRKGCCEAVNLGIQEATGDIIVQADADVRPPRDFLEQLAKKYNAGADWVLVDSRIPKWNTRSSLSRFVGACHIADHPPERNDMYYTEAFSCRRDLAIQLGMFGKEYPARFCRDWFLGKKLTEGGYKKVYDPTLVVEHPQPDNVREFWVTRTGRGRFGPLTHYFMYKQSVWRIILKTIIKNIFLFFNFVLIVPAFSRIFKVVRYSERTWRDFLPFCFVYLFQEFARIYGEWQGISIVVGYAHKKRV